MSVNNKNCQRIGKILSGPCGQKDVCPVKDIMATYGDKWSMYTILLLGQHQRLRFNELRAGIHTISQRMLTVTLRSLEEDGIVSRTLYPEIPPRVEYCLTDLGEGLLKPLLSLAIWAEENVETVLKARKTYGKKLA